MNELCHFVNRREYMKRARGVIMQAVVPFCLFARLLRFYLLREPDAKYSLHYFFFMDLLWTANVSWYVGLSFL